MTTAGLHAIDLTVHLLGIVSWLLLILILEKVSGRRGWVRLALFAPFHQAYERLSGDWGALHLVLAVAIALWLGASLVRRERWRALRAVAFSVSALCLLFLALASELAPSAKLLVPSHLLLEQSSVLGNPSC